MKPKQPFLFVSHGVMHETIHSRDLQDAYKQIRRDHLPRERPDAVVVISAHWISRTNAVKVTTGATLSHPTDWLVQPPSPQSYPGHPQIAQHIVDALQSQGIDARGDERQGLDHGAFIPYQLLGLDHGDPIPIVQVSLLGHLDPVVHQHMAAALMRGLASVPMTHNVLWIGSGGLVHNRNRIQVYGGYAPSSPDAWAQEFDDDLARQLTPNKDAESDSDTVVSKDALSQSLVAAYAHRHFDTCHPTTEHFLPLVVMAALAAHANGNENVAVTQLYSGFQWKNLSMGAYKFASVD